jgi:predicted dehydrogenase
MKITDEIDVRRRTMSVKLGIIGYGIMGERLLRAAVNHNPETLRVAAVWDPSAQSMKRLHGDFPQIGQAKDAAGVIAASDCVYIASPPSSHLSHARAVLAAGKAVFCEKPLSIDLVDARGFAHEAREARFGVNFPFASSFAVDQLKSWIAEGVVGDWQNVEIEVAFAHWPRPWQMDAEAWLDRTEQGGFTREVVSHFLFLTKRMTGHLNLNAAQVEFQEAGRSERLVGADLSQPKLPIILKGSVGTTDKPDHNTWTLNGGAGSIRLRDWSLAERFDRSSGTWQEAPDAIPNEKARPLILARQLDKVAAMTLGKPQDLATLEEALAVQEVVEAILSAY